MAAAARRSSIDKWEARAKAGLMSTGSIFQPGPTKCDAVSRTRRVEGHGVAHASMRSQRRSRSLSERWW